MTTIYLDESGYTGDDLLNAEQPYFTIASSVIGDDEARDILQRCFPRYQGDEFKFTNIWKRGTHRNGLKAFAREIPAIQDRLFLWIINKRFCLMTKMFDYLIEPLFYDQGRDFYVGGYAQRFMNSVYRDIMSSGSSALFDASTQRWDAFARAPGLPTMDALKDFLAETAASTQTPLSDLYLLALRGARDFCSVNERLEDFDGSSDIQLTSVFSIVIRWRQERPEDFDLVHDESGNFLRQRDLWTTMLRDDFVSPPLIQGNGTAVEFPLRVRSTTGVSSHTSHAVQLCDVLAGFGAKVAPGLEGHARDPFLAELIDLGAGEITYSGMSPKREYANGPPPPRDGPDMVDRMMDLLAPALAKRAAERAGRV